jgi:hypothetical protein
VPSLEHEYIQLSQERDNLRDATQRKDAFIERLQGQISDQKGALRAESGRVMRADVKRAHAESHAASLKEELQQYHSRYGAPGNMQQATMAMAMGQYMRPDAMYAYGPGAFGQPMPCYPNMMQPHAGPVGQQQQHMGVVGQQQQQAGVSGDRAVKRVRKQKKPRSRKASKSDKAEKPTDGAMEEDN